MIDATDPRIVFDTATYDFEIDTQGIEGKNVEFDPPDSTEEGYQYLVYFLTLFPDLIGLGLITRRDWCGCERIRDLARLIFWGSKPTVLANIY